MDDRSTALPPAQDPAEDDRKPAAVAALPSDAPASKRRKGEVHDIPEMEHLQPGAMIEVKWTINDDESEDGAPKDSAFDGAAKADDGDNKSGATVWWPATLNSKTAKMHTLTEQERQESEGAANLYTTSQVNLPVYILSYSPLEEFGFDTHSLEEVAFISNKTLLNLSTDEIMIFRRAGAPSPPPSPIPEEAATVPDESSISMEFNGADEIGAFMNTLMQRCLRNTGMDTRMESLPASEQLIVAERIQKAKEGMLESLQREMDQMETGNKVVTAEVVRRCMEQMRGAY